MLVAQISKVKLQLVRAFDSLMVDVNKYKDVIEQFQRLDFNNRDFINWDENGNIIANWSVISEAIGKAFVNSSNFYSP